MKQYKALEVAKRYGVTVFTVYAWMRDGKLPHAVEQRGMVNRKIITDSDLKAMESRTGIRPVSV